MLKLNFIIRTSVWFCSKNRL